MTHNPDQRWIQHRFNLGSKNTSARAAHALFAFLLGILAHSVTPYNHIPVTFTLTAISVLFVLLFLIRTVRTRYILILLLAFTLGILRFSLAQPSLPRNLIFANPKGLAMPAPMSRTANQLDPRHWLFRARVSIKARATSRFSHDQAALLTGILYGERELSKEAKTAFRHAGLLHLIAVSGSNMTIIAVITMRILLAVHLSRRLAFCMLLLAITAFTLFVGPSAAVVRAAIMGILVELAPLVGRLIRPTRLLLVTAVLFVLWQPWALAFDASFALSYLAVFGLLTYGRRWNEFLSPHIHSNIVRETLTSTAAATLLTTPYAAWAFGSFTVWGLLTNILVLPLMSWTMFLGAFALVIPNGALVLALPAEGCLEMILRIAHLTDHIRAGYLDRTFLPFSWFVVSYLLIFLSTPRKHPFLLSASSNAPRQEEKSGLTELSLYEP